MKIFGFILTFLSFTVLAQSLPNMQEAIAYDLNSILNETVNEGEMNVQVKRASGKSVMTCSIIPATNLPELNLAKCDVTFEVKLTHRSPIQKCETSCLIIYEIEKKEITQLTRNEALVEECLEDLSSTEC